MRYELDQALAAVMTLVGELDSFVGQEEEVLFELDGKDSGVEGQVQVEGEVGGGSGPLGSSAHEGLYGFDQGRTGGRGVVEGLTHFGRGAWDGGGGGNGPNEGVVVAGLVRLGGLRRSQNGGDGVADGSDDGGGVLTEGGRELLLRAAGFGSERGEVDDEGAGGEV